MNRIRACLFAIALAVLAMPLQGAEFSDQRVFTRLDEREKLDEIRAATEPDDEVERADRAAANANAAAAEKPPEVPEVRLQGFIIRSDGPPAVWLNEGNTLDGDRVDGDLRVESGRIQGQTVLIRLPDGRSIRLKPGQRFDPDSGRVRDVLKE